MKKLRLIIAHEYTSIVAKKSFIVMTLLVPFLIIIIGAVPALIAYFNNTGDTSKTTITVVDQSASGFGRAIKSNERLQFAVLSATAADTVNPGRLLGGGSKGAVVVIPPNIDTDTTACATVFSNQTLDQATMSHINKCLSDTVTASRLEALGVPGIKDKLKSAQKDVKVKGVKWNADGSEQEQSTTVAMIIGLVLSMFTYMFVLSYGAMIMNSVVEEKTNRIVEVIVSSCRPMELMLGKIVGVGLVGLTQFAIWAVLIGGLTSLAGLTLGGAAIASGGATEAAAAAQQAQSIDAQHIISVIMGIDYLKILSCFVIYFIGGYLLYASLFAGFGSAVDQASDASQFTMPIILIMIIALYAGLACIDNPGGPMAQWCSIIPFTSPVVMMIRLPFDVPAWQLALSIALLYATALACVWIAARIYRTGILMYGKKRTFGELFSWIVRKN